MSEDARRIELAHALLLDLHDTGKVQLVNRATAQSLAPELGRRLSADGAELSAWLIDQPGVAEVYATDDELAAAAAAALAAPPAPSRELPYELAPHEGAWHGVMRVDLGVGDDVAIAVHLPAAPVDADLRRLDEIATLLRGSWSRLLGPAIARYFGHVPALSDPAISAAALHDVSVSLLPERWSIQLVFDLPGWRSTGFFLDFEGDRLVDAGAAD